MKQIYKMYLIIVLISWGGKISFCQTMDLVCDGQPRSHIVMSPASLKSKNKIRQPSIKTDLGAAGVLVDWIKKITDVELPISDTVPDNGLAIYIGKSALENGLNLESIQSSSNEGLRVICDGEKILIAGQDGTSTLKAVCRLLEELGCRYFVDHEIGEVYPRTRNLAVGLLDINEKPGLDCRRIWGSGWGGETLWKVWNGHGGIALNTGHAWRKYVSKDLFAENPEYFHFYHGRRQRSSWFCTSNQELRDIFTQGVIQTIEKGQKNPSLSPPDGNGYCQCAQCRAQDDPHSFAPSSGRLSMTNRFLDFFQYIGQQVEKKYPESILSFYCYADYTQSPTNNIKLNHNLCAWLAPIRFCRYHSIDHVDCPSRQQLAKIIDKWGQVADKIGYRTYNFNLAECLVPYSKISIWKHDIPYLKKKGCIGISLETLKNWLIYGPHIYLSIRLAYDPTLNVDALMDDYYLKFYGPQAGPIMKQYWLAVDEAFKKLKCHSGSFYALHLVYTPQFLSQCQTLLKKAQAKVKSDDQQAARINMAAEGLKNAEQYIQLREALNQGDIKTAKDIYDKLLARSNTHNKEGLGNHYTVNYLKRFIGKYLNALVKALTTPYKIVHVLPDKWRLHYDTISNGLKKGFHMPTFDASSWTEVATFSNTLDAQGLPDRKEIMWYRTTFELPQKHSGLSLFFTEIDGIAIVYLNGKKVGDCGKPRHAFELDITETVNVGCNVLTVCVDHSRITELFLGGIIRPVFLMKKITFLKKISK